MMDAISGAAVTLRTLVDGSVRLTVDFEPKDRQSVMAQFGLPGQPLAVVALQVGHAAVASKPPAATYRDFGPICREAIDLCGNKQFQLYVGHVIKVEMATVEQCRRLILSQCSVESRKELDTAEGARDLFIGHIRTPFQAWLRKQSENPAPGQWFEVAKP
jgi:hypothetical protein